MTRPWLRLAAARLGWWALVAALVLLSVVALALSHGHVMWALLPLAAVLMAALVCCLPLSTTALGLLFVALLVDNPVERPGRELYRSPLLRPGRFLYLALDKTAGVAGLKCYGIELLVLAFFLLLAVRWWLKQRQAAVAQPLAPGFLMALVLAVVGLLVWVGYGLVRGGALNFSLLQMRAMLLTPLLTFLFAHSFKKSGAAPRVLAVLVLVAVLRAMVGIYYWWRVLRPVGAAGGSGGDGSYITTHSDAVLAVVALSICGTLVYLRPSLRAVLLALAALPWVVWAMVLNNRRVALVSLLLSAMAIYLMSGVRLRRRVHATLLLCAPVLLLYVGLGWQSRAAWARPVHQLQSIRTQQDNSSQYRTLENTDLIVTARRHPLLGSGFGHGYLEVVPLADISRFFAAYRYVPHNSILWLFGVGGPVGFSAYWLFLPLGVFFAARLARRARRDAERVVAAAAVAAVVCYCSQCFGDMGLQSMMAAVVLAATLGCAVAQAAAWEG